MFYCFCCDLFGSNQPTFFWFVYLFLLVYAPLVHHFENEMLQNFYKDSKKVDNKKMKTFFNYSLKFPTYVEGLDHIFNNNI